jgi:hypothetical protein
MIDKNYPQLVSIGSGLYLMVGFPRFSSWDNRGRPKKAVRGTLGFNSQTGKLEFFDGDEWYTASMENGEARRKT